MAGMSLQLGMYALTDRYPVFLALANGELGENDLAAWLRHHSRPEQVNEDTEVYA